jgi:deferrochelatase/peroxidase EfeB
MSMSRLELDDIQSGVLRPRPVPYHATYVLLRIEHPEAGRALMRRLSTVVSSAAHVTSPAGDAWLSVALSFQGLQALGVPAASLESFAPEFRQGMAARAHLLGDDGDSSPANWEPARIRSAGGHPRALEAGLPRAAG